MLPPVCEFCGSTLEVKWESGRSNYHVDEGTVWAQILIEIGDEPPNPNRERPLCRECAYEWHIHWDEMWSHVSYL